MKLCAVIPGTDRAGQAIVSHCLMWMLSALLLTSLLGGCASRPGISPIVSGSQQEQDVENLLAAAGKAASPQKESFQLQAANLLFQREASDRALSVLLKVDVNRLSNQNFAVYTLMYSKWALDRKQTELAGTLLTAARLDAVLADIDPAVAVDIHELRARFFVVDRQPIRAIIEKMALTPLLIKPEQQEANNQQLWLSLQQLSEAELEQLKQSQSSKYINGWLALTRIATAQELDIDAQASMLNDWRDQFPGHPAAEYMPPDLRLLQTTFKQRPQRVVLLIPLSGPMQKAGEAVRDGFFAAYYQAMKLDYQLPAVRVIDSQQSDDFSRLYDEAADTADLIIGPLEKEKVALLQAEGSLPIPTLALNDSNSGSSGESVKNLYLFGLNPEDEARQVATEASLHNHVRALVIAPSSDWGQRVTAAFFSEWKVLGGEALGTVLFDPSKDDYSVILQQALGITDSKTRKQWLRQWSSESIEFEPRRRQDIDVIFLAARPEQARQIKPLLAFHYAGQIPVYATSSVYSGLVDPAHDTDLNDVQILVSPWVIENSELKTEIQTRLLPASSLQPLYAMGADAWRLHARLPLLSASERSRLYGYTGILRMNEQQRIIREQLWATMDKGQITMVPVAY